MNGEDNKLTHTLKTFMSSVQYCPVCYSVMKFTCNACDTIFKTVRCACANTQ